MNMESRKIHSFKDLDAWKEAHRLVLMIYKLTKQFPPTETFGLSNQLRRAAVSVSSNIAEGFSRQHYREKLQFYATSLGSLTEIQNQILIAYDVRYIDQIIFQETEDQSIKVNKIMNGLIKSTKSRVGPIIHNS